MTKTPAYKHNRKQQKATHNTSVRNDVRPVQLDEHRNSQRTAKKDLLVHPTLNYMFNGSSSLSCSTNKDQAFTLMDTRN